MASRNRNVFCQLEWKWFFFQIWHSFFSIWKLWWYCGCFFLVLSWFLIWNSILFLIFWRIKAYNEERLSEFRILCIFDSQGIDCCKCVYSSISQICHEGFIHVFLSWGSDLSHCVWLPNYCLKHGYLLILVSKSQIPSRF